MKKHLLLLVMAMTCLFSYAHASHVAFLSYNMGQLRKGKIDIIPCPTARLSPQIEEIFNSLKGHSQFVVFLQEVWTVKAYNALKRTAELRGLEIFPLTSREANSSGTVLISNLPMQNSGFEEFSRNKLQAKGIRYTTLALPEGGNFQVANVHTSFSDSKRYSSEHRSHFEDIRKFAEINSPRNDFFVIGGDFNAGPDLVFKKQRYPASTRIWDESFFPMMTAAGLFHASAEALPTWDTRNQLVSNPSLSIKVLNAFTYGTWGWEEKTSTLDHFFASSSLEATETKLVLHNKARLRCPGRNDKKGMAHLSDHYGILTVMKTK